MNALAIVLFPSLQLTLEVFSIALCSPPSKGHGCKALRPLRTSSWSWGKFCQAKGTRPLKFTARPANSWGFFSLSPCWVGRLRRSSPSWPASIATGPNFCSTQRASCSPHLCLMQLQCTERWRSCSLLLDRHPALYTRHSEATRNPNASTCSVWTICERCGIGWRPLLVAATACTICKSARAIGSTLFGHGWHSQGMAVCHYLVPGVDRFLPPSSCCSTSATWRRSWSANVKRLCKDWIGWWTNGWFLVCTFEGWCFFLVAAILRVPFTSRVLLQDLAVEHRAWLLRLLDPSKLAEKTPTEKINILRADLRFLRQKTVAWCLRSGVVDLKVCRLVVEDPGAPCWLYMVLPNFDCCGFISWVLWFSLAATNDDYDLVLENLYYIRFWCDGKWKEHHRFFWSWWHGAGQ